MSERGGTTSYSDPGWSAWETVVILGLAMLLSAFPYWFYESARGLGADLLSYFIQNSCFLLGPLVGATVLRRKTAADLGFVAAPWGRCLLIGISAGLILYLLNILLSAGLQLLFPQAAVSQDYIVEMLAQATPFETVFLLLLLLVLAPLAEETLFRAYFFPALQYRYGRVAGYVICALVFAAAHLSLWTLLPIILASLGFCRLYEKYRCLWYNIFAHVIWNLTALAIYYFSL